MKNICRLGATLIIFWGFITNAHAQATDVDCEKCVDASDIAGGAVTTFKLRKKSVTTDRLASRAVGTGKLRNGAVTDEKLSPGVANAIAAAGNPRVLDGADNAIGQLVSIGENRWSIEVITDEGYLITVSPRDGKIGNSPSFFAAFDCTGSRYVNSNLAGAFGGYVLQSYDAGGVPGLYFVDPNTAPIADFVFNSIAGDEGGCDAQSGQAFAFLMLPNDSNITGVSNSEFPLPIKIMLP